jgi:hypothetical protein
MTLFRHGRVTLQDAERHLDTIASEEATLRHQLGAMEAQKALAEAAEAHMTEARLLLARLHDQIESIDAIDNQSMKREVIEMLVRKIRIDTKPDRHVTATITYAFSPVRVAYISTRRRGSTPRRA